MRLAPLLLTITLAGGCATGAWDRPPAPLEQQRNDELAELRRRLAQVRAVDADEDMEAGDEGNPSALVGLARAAAREALGEPRVCPDGKTGPCSGAGDWYWSFYHRPEGDPRGGPELVMRFDAHGRCIEARWAHTR